MPRVTTEVADYRSAQLFRSSTVLIWMDTRYRMTTITVQESCMLHWLDVPIVRNGVQNFLMQRHN